MQFQKGQSGNPAGRPRGSFGIGSILAAALREGEAEKIVRTTIDKAIEGDSGALRICWQRLDPLPRHDRVVCDIPALTTSADCGRVVAGILAAVAHGQLSPREASDLGKVLDTFVRSIDVVVSDFDEPQTAGPSQPEAAEEGNRPDISLLVQP
jgi:Family of unknown function (DUF5681)